MGRVRQFASNRVQDLLDIGVDAAVAVAYGEALQMYFEHTGVIPDETNWAGPAILVAYRFLGTGVIERLIKKYM